MSANLELSSSPSFRPFPSKFLQGLFQVNAVNGNVKPRNLPFGNAPHTGGGGGRPIISPYKRSPRSIILSLSLLLATLSLSLSIEASLALAERRLDTHLLLSLPPLAVPLFAAGEPFGGFSPSAVLSPPPPPPLPAIEESGILLRARRFAALRISLRVWRSNLGVSVIDLRLDFAVPSRGT